MLAPPKPQEILTPEAFLEQFRDFAFHNYKAASGKVAPSHEAPLAELEAEALGESEMYLPQVLVKTQGGKEVQQTNEFRKHLVSSCRFVGLVALRHGSDEKPELKRYKEDTVFRLGVIACLANDAIESADALTQRSGFIAPTTWSAVKPHFRSPEQVRELVEQNKDLGLSFVIKALKNNPLETDERLEATRQQIAALYEAFPDRSLGDIRLAVIRKQSDPASLLRSADEKRAANPGISTREAMRTRETDGPSIEERVEQLKNNPDFQDADIPNYVFKRAITSHGKGPEKYLQWFVKTREELIPEFGQHGIGAIHTALTEYPSDPRRFLVAFAQNLELVSNDPRYGFLSKRERYRASINHPFNLEEALAEKCETFEAIMAEPRYAERFSITTIRGLFAKHKNPELVLRRMWLRRKYRNVAPKDINLICDRFVDFQDSVAITQFINKSNRRKKIHLANTPTNTIAGIPVSVLSKLTKDEPLSFERFMQIRSRVARYITNPAVRFMGEDLLVKALGQTDPGTYLADALKIYRHCLISMRSKWMSMATLSKLVIDFHQDTYEAVEKLEQEYARRHNLPENRTRHQNLIQDEVQNDFLAGRLALAL